MYSNNFHQFLKFYHFLEKKSVFFKLHDLILFFNFQQKTEIVLGKWSNLPDISINVPLGILEQKLLAVLDI